jgi:hypothetical protein
MIPIETKSNEELLKSLLAEAAKARNEINCASGDIQKATNRLNFILLLVNELTDRK